MIEATCAACGTLNRVAEADVPVGAKFFPCASCKSRVPVPASAAATKPPALPPLPALKPIPIPVPVPKPTAAAAPGDIIDLADLPAPKRTSALGPEASKPAPRSGLAAAADADLPAPKSRAASVNNASSGSLDLDDLLAPRAADSIDLPAPKATRQGISDLPAPKPLAKTATPVKGAPLVPKAPSALADLPAPKATRTGLADLPAPKATVADLPAPKASPGVSDLPAPKGFFDDLPQPARAHAGPPTTDLAPKGFFDDLPGRVNPRSATTQDVAPKIYGDAPTPPPPPALRPPAPPTTDIAPKGFFDDLPGRVNQTGPSMQGIAPKGFFDDLPGPAAAASQTTAAQGVAPSRAEGVAPKGFFDDLPGPTLPPSVPAPRAPVPRPRAPSTEPPLLDLEDPTAGALPSIELETGPELDLGDPVPVSVAATITAPPASSFDDLDLSKPTAHSVRFDPKKQSSDPPSGSRPLDEGPSLTFKKSEASLELQDSPSNRSLPGPRLGPKRKETATPAPKTRRTKLILALVLALAAAGGGGFVLYRRHAAAEARADEIAQALAAARRAQASTEPDHWMRTVRAARQVLQLDEHNGDALAMGAEALLAAGLADGTPSGGARQMIADAVEGGVGGPQLARAQALSAILAHQSPTALGKLKPLAAAAPKDGALALYLGWAYEAGGDLPNAVASYTAAAAASPVLKVPAIYGRGRAKLAMADLEGARADFTEVLAAAKDHIGAQVGLAAALPPTQTQQQESDLLAILQRKDIATADPRAVAQAYVRAGDIAGHAGRFDVARERYKKALAAVPNDLAATDGLAETELADGRTDAAAELIGKALAQSKDDVRSQLVQAEIEVKQRQLAVAATRLQALGDRTPPLAPLERARLELITGKMLEAQGQDEAAIDAYVAGAKAAGDLDLAPTLAAVGKLAALAKQAADAKDVKSAADMRARADELLGALADHAQQDPQLALTLGIAYLQGGDAAKAEPWLRRAVDARATDADALYQLGRALVLLGKTDEAIEALKKATTLDATRADIGLALARTYEELGRASDAGELYDKLLAAPEPSTELRARAGRYYAKQKRWEKAAIEGQAVLAADPQNPAGYFLKGEGLMAQQKFPDAKQAFQRAVELDRDPQYLDGLGRAAEAMSAQSGDRELQDTALRSYLAAAEADPKLFNALAGQGRLYVARHEAAKALAPLGAANKLDPKDADVPYLMGAALHELQQNPQALPWLEQSIRLKPNALASWMVGQIYRDANQGGAAATAMAAATRGALAEEKASGKTVPWLTEALYALGRTELDLHDDAAARDAWEKYVGRNPPPSAQLTDVRQQLATSLRR